MKFKINSILILFFLLLPINGFAESQLKKQYSDTELSDLLKNEGYGSIELVKEHVLKFKVDGQTYFLYNTYDGDLQGYYAITGASISYKEINEWNRSKRCSRAYLDSDEDPVIEADIMADEGMTEDQFKNFIRVFITSAKQFREFCSENS
jgi:hypothetical protein